MGANLAELIVLANILLNVDFIENKLRTNAHELAQSIISILQEHQQTGIYFVPAELSLHFHYALSRHIINKTTFIKPAMRNYVEQYRLTTDVAYLTELRVDDFYGSQRYTTY
jgi:DNA primase large subunit